MLYGNCGSILQEKAIFTIISLQLIQTNLEIQYNMTMLYPNTCYNEVCVVKGLHSWYKVGLLARSIDCQSEVGFSCIIYFYITNKYVVYYNFQKATKPMRIQNLTLSEGIKTVMLTQLNR